MVLVTCLMSSPPAPSTLTWPIHSGDTSPLLFFEHSCTLLHWKHCFGSFLCLEHTPPDIGKTEPLTPFKSLFKPQPLSLSPHEMPQPTTCPSSGFPIPHFALLFQTQHLFPSDIPYTFLLEHAYYLLAIFPC